jgi:hypothetical protein
MTQSFTVVVKRMWLLTLSWARWIHILTPCFFKIRFSIVFIPTRRFPKRSFDKNCVAPGCHQSYNSHGQLNGNAPELHPLRMLDLSCLANSEIIPWNRPRQSCSTSLPVRHFLFFVPPCVKSAVESAPSSKLKISHIFGRLLFINLMLSPCLSSSQFYSVLLCRHA